MEIIKHIQIELTPAYWSNGNKEMELSVEWDDINGGHKARSSRIIEDNDFESRFDYYIKSMVAELKEVIKENGLQSEA